MKISIPINMMSVLAGLGICTLIVAGGLVMWIYLWLNKFGFTFDKGIPTNPKPLDLPKTPRYQQESRVRQRADQASHPDPGILFHIQNYFLGTLSRTYNQSGRHGCLRLPIFPTADPHSISELLPHSDGDSLGVLPRTFCQR